MLETSIKFKGDVIIYKQAYGFKQLMLLTLTCDLSFYSNDKQPVLFILLGNPENSDKQAGPPKTKHIQKWNLSIIK